jgi:arginyl-tRNA synthetase
MPAAHAPDPDAPLRTRVRVAIEQAWLAAVAAGTLPGDVEVDAGPRGVEVERPAQADHGDYASNLALRLARPYRRPPLAIAEAIAAQLSLATGPTSLIATAEPAAPGFINVRLSDPALAATVRRILAEPEAWGRVPAAVRRRVNVEFVSANPTGPLTVGNARGAFVGDLLCRVLEAAGHEVTREYYFNDSGSQVRKLGESVLAVAAGREPPGDGYLGAYVEHLARDLPEAVAAEAARADDTEAAGWAVGRWASERIRAGIEGSLADLGVRFDVWTTEGSLHADGWVDRAVVRLREAGHVYEQEGAVWFRSTAFGDDKDRVVIRANGEPTYFASDIGYVTEKFSRGFDHLIYVWGADHHGTVARVRNAAEAMGYDKAAVQMLLTGWVRFVRPWTSDGGDAEVVEIGGRRMTLVSMSKRAGTFITLDELLAEIGADAARWFFGSRGANLDIDFDIELAKTQSNENPVYYVQYAHARIASILRKAAEAGLDPDPDVEPILAGPPEAALVRAIAAFPEVVEDAAAAEETQGLTAYATALATTFHAFYRDARVVDPDAPAVSGHRLALVLAARTTLANALALLGISAPEAM